MGKKKNDKNSDELIHIVLSRIRDGELKPEEAKLVLDSIYGSQTNGIFSKEFATSPILWGAIGKIALCLLDKM